VLLLVPLLAGCLLLAWAPPCAAADGERPVYGLLDLYRMALEKAEAIAIAQQDVVLAELDRKRALSVLIPHVDAFTNYTRFDEDKSINGVVGQPLWHADWGLTAGQRFTINGRELTALRIAEDTIAKSRHDEDAVSEIYLIQLTEAYFDAAKVRKGLEIADANVRRLETHRHSVERRLALGEVTKTALFRADAELAEARAERVRRDNLLRLAMARLGRIAIVTTPFDIDVPLKTFQVEGSRELEVLKRRAVEQRAEIKSLAVQEEIAAKRVEYEKGAYWPTLGIEGNWVHMDQEPAPLFDDSLSVGLNLTFPLYQGGLRQAEVAQARARERQVSLARSDTARQIEIEVEAAWLDVETQKGVIGSLEAQLRFARENYEAVSRMFEHGMANSVDIMDANTLLVTAEQELYRARYNLRLADLELRRAGGILLEQVYRELDRTIGRPAAAVESRRPTTLATGNP
jgi:outer membrane protein